MPEGWAVDNPTYFGNPLRFLVLAGEGDWLELLAHAIPEGTPVTVVP